MSTYMLVVEDAVDTTVLYDITMFADRERAVDALLAAEHDEQIVATLVECRDGGQAVWSR